MNLPLQTGLLFGTGTAAGIINVLAGGGSMLSVPVLIFLGVDPLTANGTNRVAIAVQNATAVYGFRRHERGSFPTSMKLALAALPGSLVGAWLASHMNNSAFQQVLSVVLVLSVIALFLPSPRSTEGGGPGGWRRVLVYPVMFGIGLYGGFIQIGVGFIFMAGLQRLLRIGLVRVNVHKVFIILIYTLPALGIFLWRGQVDWLLGLTLAAGNAAGAWIATRLAIRGGDRWIRVVVAIAVVLMAAKLFASAL
ncbi:MAG TPA: sulfite exporter TauE/SafE family protein [Gammaproteobacteria bacterium]|nr:sulfite exporter TauE/SafE family protein [Gammaproteobacteria bacterium]